jgi:hypothetical protein
MDFKKFYSNFKYINGVLELPLDMDYLKITESGEVQIDLQMQYIKEYVDSGFLKLSINDKVFETLQEAYDSYDSLMLTEESKPDYLKGKKNVAKIIDPETGEQRELEVSLGNVKVGTNTICINMSTAHDCMSLTIGTCTLGANGQCYALSTEKRFQSSINKSNRSSEQWSCLSAKGLAMSLDILMKKMPNVKFLRLNNAGEFRNLPSDPELLAKVSDEMKEKLADVDDVGKLVRLGEELKKMQNPLIIYTYTHRTDIKFPSLPENVVINGSGYMISNAFVPMDYEDYVAALDMKEAGTLKEINGEQVSKVVTCMGDCRPCPFCKKAEGKHILIAIHGATTKANRVMNDIINKVILNSKFSEIVSKNISNSDKSKELLALLSPEDEKVLRRIVQLPQDRRDLFIKLLDSQGNSELFKQAMNNYASLSYDNKGNLMTPIDPSMINDAMIATVNNLVGKFADNQKNARELGQKTAEQKWIKLAAQLKRAIDDAKSGKNIKASKGLTKQFAGALKRN